MATESFVIESALSPEAAFSQAIDLSMVPQWDRGVRKSVLVEGDPATVGARYQVSLTGFDRQPTTAIYELTTVDDNRAFTMVGSHAEFRADDALTFEPTSDGCRVTYEASLTLLGDDPPLSEDQLANTFAAVAAIARDGLAAFLNP